MKEFNYTITDPEGIHARPAGLFDDHQGRQGSRRKAYPWCYGAWCEAGTGDHDPHGRRSGSRGCRGTGEVLQRESVMKVSSMTGHRVEIT